MQVQVEKEETGEGHSGPEANVYVQSAAILKPTNKALNAPQKNVLNAEPL